MSRPRSPMRKIREVLRLVNEGNMSRRQVSDALHVPLTTVNDYIKRASLAGVGWPLPDDLDDALLEHKLFSPRRVASTRRALPDWKYIHTELKKPGVTKWLLWEEYREEHVDGYGYTQFCQLYRNWSKTLDLVMRQEHRAGEKLFVDYAGQTISIYDPDSDEVVMDAELFVAALGASGYIYAEASASQDLDAWITAHVNTFEFMGGVAQIAVPDNLRSGVTKANRYEAELNRTYEEMATHYSIAIIPARAYKPRDKAKAEASVLLCERWIIAKLRKRHFTSLQELNAAIKECLEVINNKPFKKLDGSRRSMFEQIDRPALTALPLTRYELGRWKVVKCNIDYHIETDRHRYSVPYQLVGQYLDVRTSAYTVEVFFKSKRVASHVRSYKRNGFTTLTAHMPESHRRHAEWTPSRMIAWANKTGPSTAAFATKLIELRPHPEHGYRSILGVIRLAKHYDEARIEAACKRAIAIGSYSYSSIKSILEKNLDCQPLPTDDVQDHHRHHENIRGANYYQ